MRSEFAPLLVTAVRASGGTGAHAAAARQVIVLVVIAQMLAAAQHDGPPHASTPAPRTVRPRRSRLPHRDSLAGRRPRG